MAAKMTILATREQGTLVSTWTEYLVLNKSPGANPKLEILGRRAGRVCATG